MNWSAQSQSPASPAMWGRRGAVLFIRDAQVQPSRSSAGGRRAWRQGLGWEGCTAGRLPGPHAPGAGSGAGALARLRPAGVGCRPSPGLPHLSILSVREPRGTRRSQGSPHFLLLLSGRTGNLRGRPTRTARQRSPGPAACPLRGKVYSRISQQTTTPCPTPAQALSERHGGFLFVATASRAGRQANTCDFSFSIKVYK